MFQYQVGILSKWKSGPCLTKADRSCHLFVKERRDELDQALRDPVNQREGGSADTFELNGRRELDIENNYRMKKQSMFSYTFIILILVRILFQPAIVNSFIYFLIIIIPWILSCIVHQTQLLSFDKALQLPENPYKLVMVSSV